MSSALDKVRELDSLAVPLDWMSVCAEVVGLDRLPRTDDDEADLERYARAAWTRLAEPGNEWAGMLVRIFGPVAALAAVATRDEKVLRQFHPRLEQLNLPRDVEIAGKFDARVVTPADQEWPRGVDDLDVPPLGLWVRGEHSVAEVCRSSVAVVGARAATAYGTSTAAELSWSLAERGRAVVSGAAYGIDRAAHEGALASGGVTVAVLACGVDRPYPASNADLLATIASIGLVISEVPPGSAALRSRFLQRNRLIATMTQGTVVVEAGWRSGSRNTAGTAAEHHRAVMAVPGPITSTASAGCHEMIRSGMATLVTDVDEVMELLSPIGEGAVPPRLGEARLRDHLPEDDAKVLDSVAARPRSVGKIASIAGMGTREVVTSLGRLELAGLVVPSGSGWRTQPPQRG